MHAEFSVEAGAGDDPPSLERIEFHLEIEDGGRGSSPAMNRLSFRLQIACIPYVKACGGRGRVFRRQEVWFSFFARFFSFALDTKKACPPKVQPLLPRSTTWNGYRRTGLFSLYHIRARFVTPGLRIAARWLHSERGEDAHRRERKAREINARRQKSCGSTCYILCDFEALSGKAHESWISSRRPFIYALLLAIPET